MTPSFTLTLFVRLGKFQKKFIDPYDHCAQYYFAVFHLENIMNLDPFPKPFSCKEKPKIDYPCSWVYKVIGSDEKSLRTAIETVLGTENLLVSSSHSSSGGKYISLNVEIIVTDDESRLSGYQNLKNHAAVKVVM